MEDYQEQWARMNEEEQQYEQFKTTLIKEQGTRWDRSVLLTKVPEEWCSRLLKELGR